MILENLVKGAVLTVYKDAGRAGAGPRRHRRVRGGRRRPHRRGHGVAPSSPRCVDDGAGAADAGAASSPAATSRRPPSPRGRVRARGPAPVEAPQQGRRRRRRHLPRPQLTAVAGARARSSVVLTREISITSVGRQDRRQREPGRAGWQCGRRRGRRGRGSVRRRRVDGRLDDGDLDVERRRRRTSSIARRQLLDDGRPSASCDRPDDDPSDGDRPMGARDPRRAAHAEQRRPCGPRARGRRSRSSMPSALSPSGSSRTRRGRTTGRWRRGRRSVEAVAPGRATESRRRANAVHVSRPDRRRAVVDSDRCRSGPSRRRASPNAVGDLLDPARPPVAGRDGVGEAAVVVEPPRHRSVEQREPTARRRARRRPSSSDRYHSTASPSSSPGRGCSHAQSTPGGRRQPELGDGARSSGHRVRTPLSARGPRSLAGDGPIVERVATARLGGPAAQQSDERRCGSTARRCRWSARARGCR